MFQASGSTHTLGADFIELVYDDSSLCTALAPATGKKGPQNNMPGPLYGDDHDRLMLEGGEGSIKEGKHGR